MEGLLIPDKIKEYIGDRSCKINTVGLSGSAVIDYGDRILKVQKQCGESENELRMMEWLQGKLPVPRVICEDRSDGRSYLLMTKIEGKMSCDDAFMSNPEELISLLAEGLKMLWSVDIAHCPGVNDVDKKLETARSYIDRGLVDMENVEPETFGENGFKDAEHLFAWLKQNKPEQDLVFSHGDYCLPNIFLSNGKISGFIDLGRAGTADRWQDIALCYRSLKSNFAGMYGGKAYGGFREDLLFEKLGIEPDYAKLKYYILLDELF